MDMENFYHKNFQNFFERLLTQMNKLKNQRFALNDKINDLLIMYEKIDSVVLNSLLQARNFFHEKNKDILEEIKKLKKMETKVDKSLKVLKKKKIQVSKPRSDKKIKQDIYSLNQLVNQIDRTSKDLNNDISTKILEIKEEKKLVEKLDKLESKKVKYIKLINHLKELQISNLQKSAYFEINEKFNEKMKELTKIKEDLEFQINNRRNTHISMLKLCHNANQIKDLKQKIKLELLDHKFIACQFYSKFLNSFPIIDNDLKSIYIDQLEKRKKIQNIEKMNKLLKQTKKAEYERLNEFMRKKLEIALEKQKRGEKLHISELKLIFDHHQESKKI
ncbi:MAG: hypothetical protein EU518_00540 [Promethearchaeota archaeon]|nr:MAG: hypothetical protein EU518_00540 [Candidatus Lokiarchaeota archaeon]